MLKTRVKEHEKVAWRVVSDPQAEEQQWLAACTVLDEKIDKKTGAKADKGNGCSQPVAALIGIYCAMGVLFLAFGGCLGSLALSHFAPVELHHNFDFMVLMGLTLPVAGSLITGLSCHSRKRNRWLWLAPFLFFQALIAWACYASQGLWSCLWLPFCAAMSLVSFEVGALGKQWWRQFTDKPTAMFAPSIFFTSFLGTAGWLAVISALTHPAAAGTGTSNIPMSTDSAVFGFAAISFISVLCSAIAAIAAGTQRLRTGWLAGMFGSLVFIWPALVMMIPVLLHAAGAAVGIATAFSNPELLTYGAPLLAVLVNSSIGGALGCGINIMRAGREMAMS